MKCPNCNSDNLAGSSFCISCGKPFSYARTGNTPQEKPPAGKRKTISKKAATETAVKKTKAATPKTKTTVPKAKTVTKNTKPVTKNTKPAAKKAKPAAKKTAGASKAAPKKNKAPLPLDKVAPKKVKGQDRRNILKGVEITPLDDVEFDGAATEELKNIAALKENSEGPQLESLASANTELPKVLWPESPPEIKVEELLSEAHEEYETREAPVSKPSLKERALSLVSVFSQAFSSVGSLFPKESVRPILKPAATVIAVLGLGAVVWFAVLKPHVIDRARWGRTVTNPVLAIMAFSHETDQERWEPWSRAFPHALAAHLSHSQDIRVLDPGRVFSSLQGSRFYGQPQASYSRADLKKLAALTNADLIMTGSLTWEKGSFLIKTTIKRAKYGDDLYEGLLSVGNESEILRKTESLAQEIDGELNFRSGGNGPSENNGNGMVIFPVTDAYKHYVEGQWQFWQRHYRDSINAYDLALEADPEFAQAHVEMARSYAALGYPSRAGEHFQTALEKIDRLTEKERLQVQGELYRLSEKTLLIAQDIYLRLLEVSPEDPRIRVHLGELYTQLGEWDKAAGIFDLGIQKGAKTADVYLGRSMNYALQGDFKKARAAINDRIQDLPEAAFLRMQLAWIHLMQGDFNAALGELERGYSVHPYYSFIRMKGDVLLLSGDLASALSEYNRLLTEEEAIARLWARRRLGAFYVLQGKVKQAREQLALGLEEAETQVENEWRYDFHLDLARLALESRDARGALQECDSAWKIAMLGETREFPRRVLLLRGLAYLAQSRISEAERTAELLKSLCEKGPGRDRMRSYFLLKGRIEMSRDNYAAAIEYINQGVEHLPPQAPPDWECNDHALYYDSLAEAYYARGDPGRAYEELNKLRSLLTGRLEFGDLFARTFYKQAKISEEKLLPDTAVKLYEKFLSFWGEGNLGSSEVSDARLRLRAIQGMLP
jgi:tetratricopeptide (TPR) repeat protein